MSGAVFKKLMAEMRSGGIHPDSSRKGCPQPADCWLDSSFILRVESAKVGDKSMATPSAGITNSIYCLALSLTPSLGPTRERKLVERFGAIQDIFHTSLTELEAENLQAQSAQHIALGKSLELAHDEMAKAVAAGVQILCRDDQAWPGRLSEIYDPPLVLYVRGNAEALSRPGIAVVGTRHPTPYGIGMAERLSCDLAARGLTIFSGMARGVDTAGHRGAIHARGKTVAVFGTGADVIYPREN